MDLSDALAAPTPPALVNRTRSHPDADEFALRIDIDRNPAISNHTNENAIFSSRHPFTLGDP